MPWSNTVFCVLYGDSTMNTELETVKRFYKLYKDCEKNTPPRQTIFRWKCPQCNQKLNKESVKTPLFAEEGGKEFSNQVCEDYSVPPGLYNISMDHFTCSCGYDYIAIKLDKVEM